MKLTLTVPCFQHILYDEFDETNLTLGNAARVSVKHWHHNWQCQTFLLVRLCKIFLGDSVLDDKHLIRLSLRTIIDRCEHYLPAHSTQNANGRAGLLTSAHLMSIRRISMWLSSQSTWISFSFSLPKTLTNFAKCSKWRVISVAKIISTIIDRIDLYVSRSKFLKILILSSRSVNRNMSAAWWDSRTHKSLYKMARELFALHRNADERPGWSMSWAAAEMSAVASSMRSINWPSFFCSSHKKTLVAWKSQTRIDYARRRRLLPSNSSILLAWRQRHVCCCDTCWWHDSLPR